MGPFEFILVALFLVLSVIIWWQVFSRAGWSPPLAILVVIPLVNLIVMFTFAFTEWPIQRELRHLRELRGDQQASATAERPA